MSDHSPIIFDLALPALELEAGARVDPHLVRGWWWGPEEDLPWLTERGRNLCEDAGRSQAEMVVRRGARCQGMGEVPLSLQHGTAECRDGCDGSFGMTDALRAGRGDATSPPASAGGNAQVGAGHVGLRRGLRYSTVLVVHALTGDMRAGGEAGWWKPVIGPGRALDPGVCRILCFNNLGSCYGTVGPADEGFPTRADDVRFPLAAPRGKGARRQDDGAVPATITSWDMARSILLALDALGIGRVDLATGGSLGGMVVLCLAALAPDRFARITTFGATARASPWIVGWNHVGREAVLMDPGYPEHVERGLELARQIGHMTYRAQAGLELRQGRRMGSDAALERAGLQWSSRAAYAVETYLEHQGAKLRDRFDARAYLAQLAAMDHHDLERAPPGFAADAWQGLRRIHASVLAVGIDSDALFFPADVQGMVRDLSAGGTHAVYRELSSPHGHDAFLIEFDQVGALLSAALALPAA